MTDFVQNYYSCVDSIGAVEQLYAPIKCEKKIMLFVGIFLINLGVGYCISSIDV